MQTNYLNCPDSNAANVIMIELPDPLARFFKVCQNREEARTKPTTTAASDLKLDPSERGPLSYVTGYIVSKLYQKTILGIGRMNAMKNCKHYYYSP